MYKFLVVDDEEIVRRGFRTKIPWGELGFEFLEPCENGREALTVIGRERPDVVMTDICMPLVDGLEVAAHIADTYPEITVVVLSGYDDFEYARSAMRSRVVEYLLKPITSSELGVVVRRLKEGLDLGVARSANVIEITDNASPFPVDFAKAKVEEAQRYLERNFTSKRISVETACRDLAVSASYLSRLLRKHLGKTFIDLLTEKRIERAKELLSTSDLKTYSIADAVGLRDPHYFSTIFRKSTGVTPSEYRSHVH
ncbi:MAG TPA: response regulator [Spirochaetia bacterium]|nr:response regulator [Spirochaetia bacterium]